MDFYQVNLAVLIVANSCYFIYRHYTHDRKRRRRGAPRDEQGEAVAQGFKRRFLLVYTLVVAADWLQVCLATSFYRLP